MKKSTTIFLLAILFLSCTTKTFKKLNGDDTGIRFANNISENDSINILNLEYVYNGGGVAIGDFNNDGQQDVFFTGNTVGNRLYLNKGDMEFKDVTETAGIAAAERWNTGVATVDINNDGWMDIYVCASIKKDSALRANMLFINKGLDKNGTPVFTDEAEAYGVADKGYSTMAAFFDYDNDGDLDLYVLTNKMAEGDMYPNQYHKKISDGSSPTTDRLYRNDRDSATGQTVFKNVSAQAGILMEGFGLGLNICDINKDGWKDIYVTNDFLTNDLLWINNRNGTFTNRAAQSFKHTSYSAMGNDVVDINNDGLPDVIAVDMLPADNIRKKTMMPANSYQTYMNNEAFQYEYQYGRNTLQLNMGTLPSGTDSAQVPLFGDIAFFAGVAETDWSWAPMVADFNNDGYRDLLITNGFPKDITDRDFMTYRVNATSVASKEEILEQIPEVKLHNYIFRNEGNLQFTDKTLDWGLEEPSFSNGGAYGDLDGDGDLDLVINNINDEAFVYENTSRQKKDGQRYLQVKFEGEGQNRNGIGVWAEVYYGGGLQQVYENSPYRGFLSTVQPLAHFGLDNHDKIDSLVIRWPNNKKQVIRNVSVDQVITVNSKNATQPYGFEMPELPALFADLTDSLNIPYMHKEIDFPDFNVQKLLPHKLSEYGPGMAVGDVDNNGLDDIVCGGSFSYSATLLLQQKDGKFITKDLLPGATNQSKTSEDLGLMLFDADGDGDLDLYIASGSYENKPNSSSYADRFFSNDGKGNFSEENTALPENFTSKSCVRAVDYDKDGDLDLFVAGRVEPWHYPKPVSSFLYRNDTKNGKVQFTDVTGKAAPALVNKGLICDAVWTDFDNDGWTDLVLSGEWMSIAFLKNESGTFRDITQETGIAGETGWWNSIAPGDFDNDGDIDYIVGNAGQNTFYRVDAQHPARIYAKDFDNNGNYDAIPTLFLKGGDGVRKEFPAQTRDDLIKQMISMRAKFHTYRSFAFATIDSVLTKDDLKDALVLQATQLQSSFIKNMGNGKFELIPLPVHAQLSAINGMVVDDFNGDGNLDVVMNTNDYGPEVSVGRYDALNGLFLQGDGRGGFQAVTMAKSGICIPGNGKAMVQLILGENKPVLVAAQNRGRLKVFSPNAAVKTVQVAPGDKSALIRLKDGRVQKQEFHYGATFLSQSSRFLPISAAVQSVEIKNEKGETRKISL